MTEWPKNPDYNDFEGTVEPLGPMNVFNEKLAVVKAVNAAVEAKAQYDTDHPPAAATATVPPPATPSVSAGPPVGTGGPITVDESKYVIDPHKRRR